MDGNTKLVKISLIVYITVAHCSNVVHEKVDKKENIFKQSAGPPVSTEHNVAAILKGGKITTNSTERNKLATSSEINNVSIYMEKHFAYNTMDKNRNVLTRENYPKQDILEIEDIDHYLLQNETQNFLSTFKSINQRNIIKLQLKYCPYTQLCGFSFGLSQPNYGVPCCRDCSCDFPACMQNISCCPDIIFNHINMFNSTVVNNELPRYFVEGQKVQKGCIPLALLKGLSEEIKSVYGYSTCPLDTEAELVQNCTRQYNANNIQDLTDTIPVINKKTSDLFRNLYCALCNGRSESQVEKIKFRLSCFEDLPRLTNTDILHAIYSEGNCKVDFLPEQNIEKCDSVISGCNFTGTLEGRACSKYTSVIYVNNKYFQNVFCSLCNGILPENLVCPIFSSITRKGIFSFSGLLKLDKAETTTYTLTAGKRCLENQIHDTVSDSCRDLVCSDITVLRHGKCIDMFEKLENIVYTVFLRLKPNSPLSNADVYRVADDFIDYMRDILNGSYLCGMQILYKSNMTITENEQEEIQNSNLVYFDVRTQYYVSKLHDPYQVTEHLLKLHESEHTFLTKNIDKILTLKIEVKDNHPRKFDIVSVLSDEIGNDQVLNLTILVQNYATPGNDNSSIFPHLRVNDDIGSCHVKKKEINVLSLTRCPKVKISASEVPWLETESSVKFVRGDYIIETSQYYFFDENNIMLCADKYRQYMSHLSNLNSQNMFSAEVIVSIVCSAISILSLCFTFFTFCFFSQLRQTTPGKNNMSLIFTLLCAQSLYLIGSFIGLERGSTECAIFGILIHFSWLVALFWMNICTYHMFRVLTRHKVISYSPERKRFVFYHFYAFTMAAIFLSINIAVSKSMYGTIGYGIDVCYISSQRMIIYTFVIPTGVIILSNLVMFIIVIVKIKTATSVKKNVQNERNDIIIFAKLSTITGVTWSFGFLYLWTNITAMSYLFILMNASQGVFIMFAFVINKRVFDLFKKQVFGWTVTSSDSSRPTTKTFLNVK